MTKLSERKNGKNENSSAEMENQNQENFEFQKDELKSKDTNFFKFENEGSAFTGKFIEEFTEEGSESNPNKLEGFLFSDLNGNNFLLPHYYKIGEYIKEKTAEGLDFSKTVFKIVLNKITDSKKGKLFLFDFFKSTQK